MIMIMILDAGWMVWMLHSVFFFCLYTIAIYTSYNNLDFHIPNHEKLSCPE